MAQDSIHYPLATAYLVISTEEQEAPGLSEEDSDEVLYAGSGWWLASDDRMGGDATELTDEYMLSLEPQWPDDRSRVLSLYLTDQPGRVEEALGEMSKLERHALGPLLEELDHLKDPTLGHRKIQADQDWGSQTQPFWRPGANPTVDLVVCAKDSVLLIQRADGAAEGGRWALPGGFHDTAAGKGEQWQPGRESATQAALRELQEETGLDARSLMNQLSYVGYFGSYGRDPRNNQFAWAVSNAFRLDMESQAGVSGLDDAQDARWVSYDQLADMELAFDHADILRRAGLPVT